MVLAGGGVACSPRHTATRPGTGVLAPGTVQLAVDHRDLAAPEKVQCASDEWLTTITIGDDASGATVTVSKTGQLTVESVLIRALGEFTGNYNRGLDGDAEVTMIESTYDITGVAQGYTATSFERTVRPFAIKVAC
ncbi:hypothetical protein DQP56_13660 [Mycolicibacter senuensis]|nr:hypothetical protein DQP56_13660 [Mycolicibacter senuensis]